MDERRRGVGGGDSKELKTPRQDVKAEIESQRNQIRELVDSVKKISLECDEKTRTLKLIRSKFSSSAAKSIKFGEKGKKKKSPQTTDPMESSIRSLFLSSRRKN